MPDDRNSLAFWFPRIDAAELPVPETRIVRSPDLVGLLDGTTPEGYARFVVDLTEAAQEIGYPCFLRTGHGSGKHSWDRTCYVRHYNDLVPHVAALVEWSALVDLMGLPTNVWAVRKLIPTAPLFYCNGYGGFPVVREFRFFVRDGEVEHWQPYWPADAVLQGRPSVPDWRTRLARGSELIVSEREHLEAIAVQAAGAVGGGYWSVDLLEDVSGAWWLTDMAEGDRSFRWDAAPSGERTPASAARIAPERSADQ